MQGKRLTEGSVAATLIRFSLPFLAANVLQALYGAADLVIVGQFADAATVAAVATGSQVMQTVTGVCVGLTTGGTVMIAQHFGAGNRRGVADTVAAILLVFGVLAVGLTAALRLLAAPACMLMKLPAEAVAPAQQYLSICAWGIMFIIGYNAVSGVMRGLGNSRTPLLFVMVACVLNVAGDLLLVGGLHMGAAGAAVATVGAQAFSLLLCGVYLLCRGMVAHFQTSGFRVRVCSMGDILRVGTPIALQDGLINVSFLLITAIVNSMGVTAAAALGVVEKLIVFSMLPTTAFASAVAAMTAQNKGAGLMRRARQCLAFGTGLSLVLGTAFFIAVQYDAAFFIRLFTADSAVIKAGAAYLRSYSADCIVVCFVFCMNAFFSGCGHSSFPLLHSVLATFLVRVPLSWYFSRLPGLPMFAIGCAAPVATLLSLLLCAWYLHRMGRPVQRVHGR